MCMHECHKSSTGHVASMHGYATSFVLEVNSVQKGILDLPNCSKE